MQTKEMLMFAIVAILVGSIVSMTTAGVVAAQTGNSSNNDNISINNCQEIDSASNNADSATAVASDSESGGTDDADEPGDIDVNDEEDTDTGNEDAGEANDDEEEEESSTVSTSANENVAGTNDQAAFDPCNFSNKIVDNPDLTPGTTFVAFRQAMGGVYSSV
jgi:hypothetical protein